MSPNNQDSNALIYLVDDDPSVCKALTRLVSSIGLEIVSFNSAEDCLKVSQWTRPHCLILDVHLPGMSGLELQQHLQARLIQVPVIFITAHDDVPARDRAMRAGAIAYLHKPFEDSVLIDAIYAAIGSN